MKESTPEQTKLNSSSVLNVIKERREGDFYAAYIGLDVHKKTIAVAVAVRGKSKPIYRGEIANTPKAIRKLVEKLNKEFGGEILLFTYEAGPCGYELYYQLMELGQACEVVAPSLIPQKAGERIKTDRRDAIALAKYSRDAELTAVWVPGKEQEAIRDLVRAREDLMNLIKKAKLQLGAFLLRQGRVYDTNKSRWTTTHFNWLETVKFENPIQQIVLQENINLVKELMQREQNLIEQMQVALQSWSLKSVVEGLIALRGVDFIAAMTIMAELGDISRFDSPKELMGFLGLVPSEHSSGGKRSLGSITKAGNGHVRRVLIESAWCYRFPARLTKHLRKKESKASDTVKKIAWSAQKRLCGRYRKLMEASKQKNVTCVAIARELTGFIWAIVCAVMDKPHGSKCLEKATATKA